MIYGRGQLRADLIAILTRIVIAWVPFWRAQVGSGNQVCGRSGAASTAFFGTSRLTGLIQAAYLGSYGVFNFGCPRVGDARFARDYRAAGDGGLADRTFRFLHGDDLVPRVPPAEAPFGFHHVGRALDCAHGALFDPTRLAPDTPEPPPSGWSALPGLVKSLFQTPGVEDLPRFPGNPVAAALIERVSPAIRDHLMDRYLRALGAL